MFTAHCHELITDYSTKPYRTPPNISKSRVSAPTHETSASLRARFVVRRCHFLITNGPNVDIRGNGFRVVPSVTFNTHTGLKFITAEAETPISPPTAAENRPECNSAARRGPSCNHTSGQMIMDWEARGDITRPFSPH